MRRCGRVRRTDHRGRIDARTDVQRGHRPQLLVGDPQPFAAGGQYPHRRRPREDRLDQIGRGVAARARSCRTPTAGPCPPTRRPRLADTLSRLLGNAQHRRHRIGHRRRIGDRGQLEKPDPVGKFIGQPRRDLHASRVLPTPPTPVNVTSRCALTAACTSSSSDSRPMKLLVARRRFPGLVSSARNGGKSVRRPGART